MKKQARGSRKAGKHRAEVDVKGIVGEINNSSFERGRVEGRLRRSGTSKAPASESGRYKGKGAAEKPKRIARSDRATARETQEPV
jgi:hypothetical protein